MFLKIMKIMKMMNEKTRDEIQSDVYSAFTRFHAEGPDIPSWIISILIMQIVGWPMVLGYLIACWFVQSGEFGEIYVPI